LFESFYRSIADDTPLPTPYRKILLTARIMDAIFEQVRIKRLQNHLGFFPLDRATTSPKRIL